MASKLSSDKSLVREIHPRCLSAPVNITITTEGIVIAPKRSRKPLTISWMDIIQHAQTPENIPAKFFQRPFEFLVAELHKGSPTAWAMDSYLKELGKGRS